MISFLAMSAATLAALWLGRRRGRAIRLRHPEATVETAHRHVPELRVLFPFCLLASGAAVFVFSRYQLVWSLPAGLDAAALPFLYTCSVGFLCYIAAATLTLAWQTSHRERRKMTWASGVLLLAFACIYVRHSLPVYPDLRDDRTDDGAILQTSPYTCAPASAANLLALRGVGGSEREMARIANTTDLGTTPGGILRCLRARGVAAHKAILTVADLRAAPGPVLLLVDYPGLGALSHAIVLERIEGETARVIDPLSGRIRMDVDQLQQRWRGHAICADDPGGGAHAAPGS